MLKRINMKKEQLAMNALTFALLAGFPMAAYAAGVNEFVSRLLGTVCNIFILIGALLLVWAIGALIMAFKNDDADSKSRNMQVVIVAAILLAFKGVVEAALTAFGVTGITVGQSLLG